MAVKQRPSTSAVAYATALLQLADERRQTEPVANEMKSIGDTLAESPELRDFFTNPGITEQDRLGLIDRVFTPRLSPTTLNFVKLLNAKGKLTSLGEIADAFEMLLDERHGKVEVDVTVSQRLSPQELELVRQRIGAAIKKDAVVHQYVDESIIGGIIVKVGDQLIDGSVKAQLDAMRKRLLASR